MKRQQKIIKSIFGQIEGVVADAMATEGKVLRIAPVDIPLTVRFNETGEVAHCALVFTRQTEREFDERVANLYA